MASLAEFDAAGWAIERRVGRLYVLEREGEPIPRVLFNDRTGAVHQYRPGDSALSDLDTLDMFREFASTVAPVLPALVRQALVGPFTTRLAQREMIGPEITQTLVLTPIQEGKAP